MLRTEPRCACLRPSGSILPSLRSADASAALPLRAPLACAFGARRFAAPFSGRELLLNSRACAPPVAPNTHRQIRGSCPPARTRSRAAATQLPSAPGPFAALRACGLAGSLDLAHAYGPLNPRRWAYGATPISPALRLEYSEYRSNSLTRFHARSLCGRLMLLQRMISIQP